jgi:hypothetical protein
MSQPVQIALIAAVTIVIVLVIFRRQLKDFIFKFNREGVDAHLSTHKPESGHKPVPASTGKADTRISGNRLFGRDQRIDVRRPNTDVSENWMMGRDQVIAVLGDDPQILHLHQQIAYHFSLNDFRILCQDLDVDPGRLAGEDLPAKTQALLVRIQKQESLSKLVASSRRLHPELSWDDV